MSQTTFEAEAGVLGQAAAMVGRAHDDLDTMARQLQGRVDGYLGGWSGAGADAFVQLHQAWQERHRRIVGVLTDLQASFVSTQTQASERDDAARAALGRVFGGL